MRTIDRRHQTVVVRLVALLLLPLLATACATPPNPSFPITTQQAYRALEQMAAAPKAAPRPVVFVGGFADPGFVSAGLRKRLAPMLAGTPTLDCAPGGAGSFAAARRQLVDAVQLAWPSADPTETVEVDAVCVSMGGLVAIHAADAQASSPDAGTRRLRVVRVFTIASPLRGAVLAEHFDFIGIVKEMRPGSPFLARIDAVCASRSFQLFPYTRTDDGIVGAANTAPPGALPWWVPGEFGQSDHLTVQEDPRILADIARRLRGDEPFSREPRAPLPGSDRTP
ncbi:MAG: hypothetical protein U0625_13800 [Phycisphaerales bacterium]